MNFKKPDDAGETMTLSKIGQRRQFTIPKTIFEDMKFQEGDFVEVTKIGEDELLLKKKLVVDPKSLQVPVSPPSWNDLPPTVPPPQTREDRLRLLKLLEGDATDDSEDIDVNAIAASRTSKDLTISFDD